MEYPDQSYCLTVQKKYIWIRHQHAFFHCMCRILPFDPPKKRWTIDFRTAFLVVCLTSCWNFKMRSAPKGTFSKHTLVFNGWIKVCFNSFVLAEDWNASAARQKVTYWHKTVVMDCMMGLHILNVNFLPEPPVLAQGPAVIGTGIGQSLNIPCMLLDGIPLPERHWSHNGKPVMWPSSNFIRTLHRLLLSVFMHDSGSSL